MNRLDRLLLKARATGSCERATLTFEDGTQKAMINTDALLAIIDGQENGPRVTATDQPPGSLVWALFESCQLHDEWPEELLREG